MVVRGHSEEKSCWTRLASENCSMKSACDEDHPMGDKIQEQSIARIANSHSHNMDPQGPQILSLQELSVQDQMHAEHMRESSE
mmetsp:Transcript_35915/g.112345  ORF Transcript_35915/g.112345 Transcript_35915/m.112345 type:complete len:83 (-) Transcript_35915:99-347(-)